MYFPNKLLRYSGVPCLPCTNTNLIFIHSVFCLTTGPKPPPKRCLHIVRCRASSFKWEYPLLSLRSSSSFLRLLPRLLATSISPFIFPSITCFRRRFLRKMWPIQLAFLFLISCRIFLCSLTLSNTSSFLAWSVQLIFSILLQHHISKLPRYFWYINRWKKTKPKAFYAPIISTCLLTGAKHGEVQCRCNKTSSVLII